jgi:hypothetical protein
MYATTSFYKDLVDSYILFGDPALKLQTVPVFDTYMPLVNR